ALGNVLRGVPLNASGFFEMPLWTTFGTGGALGILDWYTVLIGVFALVTIAGHGALFLAWKTEGPVHDQARALVMKLWSAVLVLWMVASYATSVVSPEIFRHLPQAPLAWLAILIFLAGLALVFVGTRQEKPLMAFLGSSAFILGLLAASAACVYPVMLKSTLDPAFSLTALNASVGAHGLRAGLVWWLIGFPIAVGYFVLLFRFHRGKVKAAAEGEGY
ncbi:MAG TPA: cytochrome d ubiquinol oxidase subunit II, partial [Holophagaceae bacterium]